MSRFVFEPATQAHDDSLRKLFSENAMEGDIEISFHREPSYFHASSVQAPFYQVFSARDTKNNEIIGVATRAVRLGYINREVTNIGYLADMRLDARHRNGHLVARAYRHLWELHQDGRTKIYFTVIAEGNKRALDTIATGRAGIPPYRELGRILCPAINLLQKRPNIKAEFEIVRGSRQLLPEIVECLNRNHQSRQLASYYTLEHFSPDAPPSLLDNGKLPSHRLHNFKIEDFYVAIRRGKIIGVLGKWDQESYKQTMITRYRGKLKVLRPLYNFAANFLGFPRFPSPGKFLRSFYASFIAIDKDDVNVFRALLRELYNDHVGSHYHYFLVGLHEGDPLSSGLSDFRTTPFAAKLFAVCFEDGKEILDQLAPRLIPYIELAML